MQIFKYHLAVIPEIQAVSLPAGAKIISVITETIENSNKKSLVLYAEIDSSEEKREVRMFYLLATGDETIGNNHVHLATVEHYQHVWHIYELKD